MEAWAHSQGGQSSCQDFLELAYHEMCVCVFYVCVWLLLTVTQLSFTLCVLCLGLLNACCISYLQEDFSFWFAILTTLIFQVDFATDAVEFCCSQAVMAGNAVQATTEVETNIIYQPKIDIYL